MISKLAEIAFANVSKGENRKDSGNILYAFQTAAV